MSATTLPRKVLTPRILSLWVGLAVAGALAGVVEADCTLSTTGVSFGSYDVFSASPLDSTGSIAYRCSSGGGTNITISLNKGGASAFNPRRMLSGSVALNYNLYLNAGRTTIWGDGTGGTQVYNNPSAPGDTNITVTIYGRIPAQQDVPAGTYSNTITATANF